MKDIYWLFLAMVALYFLMKDGIGKMNTKGSRIYDAALRYVGYARNQKGIYERRLDCSGLFYEGALLAGEDIPTWSQEQYKATTPIDESTARNERGAMLFFSKNGSPEGIYHVEMSGGNGLVLGSHVSDGVKERSWGWWTNTSDDYVAFYGRLS